MFNTRFFPEDYNSYKLDSTIISSFANLIVCLLVAAAFNRNPSPPGGDHAFGVNVGDVRGWGVRLTASKIKGEIMAGVGEPITSMAGKGLLFASMLFAVFSLPYFGESYDGCDVLSMTSWKTLQHLKKTEYDTTWASLKGGTAVLGEGQDTHTKLVGLYTMLSPMFTDMDNMGFAPEDPPPFITTPITDDINGIPDQTFAEIGQFNTWITKYNLHLPDAGGRVPAATAAAMGMPPIDAIARFPSIPALNGCEGYNLDDGNWPTWAVSCLVCSILSILIVTAALAFTYKPLEAEDEIAQRENGAIKMTEL